MNTITQLIRYVSILDNTLRNHPLMCAFLYIVIFSVSISSIKVNAQEQRWNESSGTFLVWNGNIDSTGFWRIPGLTANTIGAIPFVSDKEVLEAHGWREFMNLTFTEIGQIKNTNTSACFSTRESGAYIYMEACDDSDINQKFKFRHNDYKIESKSFPGECISFGYSGLYLVSPYGNLYLYPCNIDSDYSEWGYRFGESEENGQTPGTGATWDAAEVTTLNSITVSTNVGPHAGEDPHTYHMEHSVLIKINDWTQAHFMLADTVDEQVDCNDFKNPSGLVTPEGCRAAFGGQMTCSDYNNIYTAQTGTNNHYNYPLKDIKEWWFNREDYLEGADIVINTGWFDVEVNAHRADIVNQEACTGIYGFLSIDGKNYSRTNDVLDSHGTYTGVLDALLITENEATANDEGKFETPKFIEDISIVRSEDISSIFFSDHSAQKVNGISGIIIAEGGEVNPVLNDVASPNKVVARTIIALGEDNLMYIWAIQNGRVADGSDQTSHHAGIDLWAAAEWLLRHDSNIQDIIALDGSGSTSLAADSQLSSDPGEFHTFVDDLEGRSIIVTKPGDADSSYRRIPQVLMIDVAR